MPTVAAAAPTANAYLAPVSSASTTTPWPTRPVMPPSFQPASAMATPQAKRPSLIISLWLPRLPKAMTASSACSTRASAQLPAVLPWVRVVRPMMAQEVMPVKAAR